MAGCQTYIEVTKKGAKFIWRHILTFYILSVIIRAAIAGNVMIFPTFLYLGGAIILDWAKKFIKPNYNKSYNPGFTNHADDFSAPLHNRQPWNSSIIGTPTNLMDNNSTRD